jgi:macrophage erythroblast attacher
LKALATSEASTRAQVARELREMETNLQKLRRDLIAARAADADVTQSVLRRAEFASKHENASELSNADVQVILDRLVVDFLLRIGHADAARRLAEQAGVAALCDFALFDEMHAVLGALRSRNCAPALQWCAEHHSQLSKLPAEVDVEFELRAQMFLGLLRAGQRADALQYARKWFPAHAERHLPALQRTMACLAFDPDTQHPRYRPLFDEAARFAELSRRFVRAALALAGAPAAAPLLVYTIAALATLKTTACTIDSDRVDACPVCTEPLRELAANVPVALRQQSFLLCRMSGAVMGDDNPPLALPNGNVYSTSALTEQAAMNDGNVRDIRTGELFKLSDCVKLHVL